MKPVVLPWKMIRCPSWFNCMLSIHFLINQEAVKCREFVRFPTFICLHPRTPQYVWAPHPEREVRGKCPPWEKMVNWVCRNGFWRPTLLQLNVTFKTSEWNNKGLPHAWLIKCIYLQKNTHKKCLFQYNNEKSRCVDCDMGGERHRHVVIY